MSYIHLLIQAQIYLCILTVSGSCGITSGSTRCQWRSGDCKIQVVCTHKWFIQLDLVPIVFIRRQQCLEMTTSSSHL